MIIAIKINNNEEVTKTLEIFYQEGWDVSKNISPRETTYILIYVTNKKVLLANHSGIATNLVIHYDLEDIRDIAEGNYPFEKYNECIVMSKSDYGDIYKQASSILQKGGWKNLDSAPPIDSTVLYLYPQSKEYSLYSFKNCPNVYKVTFNPSLLEAITSMSNKEYGVEGEWWKCTDPGATRVFSKGKLYRAGKPLDLFCAFIDNEGTLNGFSSANLKHFEKATIQDLIDYFYLKTKKERPMNYKIQLSDMKRIWDIACSEWQPKISKMATEYRPSEFSDHIMLPEAVMKEMLKACTEYQRPIVEEIFSGAGYKSDKNLPINEMAERYCGGVIANTTTHVGKDKAMISLLCGDYTKFYLSNLFDWKIEGNSLIPTPKK